MVVNEKPDIRWNRKFFFFNPCSPRTNDVNGKEERERVVCVCVCAWRTLERVIWARWDGRLRKEKKGIGTKANTVFPNLIYFEGVSYHYASASPNDGAAQSKQAWVNLSKSTSWTNMQINLALPHSLLYQKTFFWINIENDSGTKIWMGSTSGILSFVF